MKLIILDQDSVISRDSEQFIRRPTSGVRFRDRSNDRTPQSMGLEGRVASNQSGVGRGVISIWIPSTRFTKRWSRRSPRIGWPDAIFFVRARRFHLRLPQAQARLLGQIAERFNVDLTGYKAWGQSQDLQAGVAVGCAPYLVLTGKDCDQGMTPALPPGTRVFPHLAAIGRRAYHLSDIVEPSVRSSVLF